MPTAAAPLRVFVLGSGAREHALATALARSPSVAAVLVGPGNGGTQRDPGLVHVALDAVTPAAVVALCERQRVDLVVVGPEAPLCDGVVDALAAAGVLAFGPTRAGAELEGSKAFLKRFATRHGIPTAPYEVVTDFAAAERVIEARGAPIVVKADGLCAGKGVVVASTKAEALAAARAMLVDGAFGAAGRTVVLEDCLVGGEVSIHAITDGERLLVLPVARDHKRVHDDDRGPNTGGMGVIAPAPLPAGLLDRIRTTILEPTLAGLRADRIPFRGVLFAGLMITAAGDPMLLEYNVRFGDPECEALLALLEGDVGVLLASVARGELDAEAVRVAADRHAAVVVLAAHGYPGPPRAGDRIDGLAAAASIPGVRVFHAGTKAAGDALVTAGGRVLAITAAGASPDEARARAYEAAGAVRFDGAHYRTDIGRRPAPAT